MFAAETPATKRTTRIKTDFDISLFFVIDFFYKIMFFFLKFSLIRNAS